MIRKILLACMVSYFEENDPEIAEGLLKAAKDFTRRISRL
jgi:hypothetical protein